MKLKFYVISFLCHLLLLFAIYVKPVKDVKLDSKNSLKDKNKKINYKINFF